MNAVSQRLSPTWSAEYQWITQRGQSWYTTVCTVSRSLKEAKVGTPTCIQSVDHLKSVHQRVHKTCQSWYTNVYVFSGSPEVAKFGTPTSISKRPNFVHQRVYQRDQSWYTKVHTISGSPKEAKVGTPTSILKEAKVCIPTCIPKRPKLVHQSVYHQRVTQRGQSWYTNVHITVGRPTCILGCHNRRLGLRKTL